MKFIDWKSGCTAVALIGLCFGCDGYIQEHGDDELGAAASEEGQAGQDEGSDGSDGTTTVTTEVCEALDTGAGPLHRLTERQYNNTVRDLFAGVDLPTQTFPAEEKVGKFDANVSLNVDERMVEAYQEAAETISVAVIQDPAAYTGCPDKTRECIHGFIEDLAERAYRRPLSNEELSALTDLYDWSKQEYTTKTSVRLVIQALLQSPHFLYRVEEGEPTGGELLALTDYEMASRLSYLLWDSAPDDELLAAAEAGQLSTADQVEQQARRLLADPRGRETLVNFAIQWFGLDELDHLEVPDSAFDETVRESMQAETVAFIDHVMFEESGTLEELLTADYTFVDKTMAPIYGVEAPDDDSLVRVDLGETKRSGLLTLPSLLATHSEGAPSVYRGEFVQAALLCSPLPPPPDEFVDPPETYEGQSSRERATDRMEHSQCGVCHKPMEGIGLAFDEFDVMGRQQSEDRHGNALSDESYLYGGDIAGEVHGVADLAERLAGSEQVRECMTKQMFRYAMGRYMSPQDRCSKQMMQSALETSNYDLKELLVAITRTDSFRYKRRSAQ